MNIQNASQRSGLSRRMIRHYEELGLIETLRRENNYRDYSPDMVDRLRLIRALRSLGFSLSDVGKILNDQNSEAVFSAHLQDLLAKQHEKVSEIKIIIDTIKSLLRTKDKNIFAILDLIGNSDVLPIAQNGLGQILQRGRLVTGGIEELDLIAERFSFGSAMDFQIKSISFWTYAEFMNQGSSERVSLVSCNELYSHLALLSDEAKDETFHRKIWTQFAKSWSKVARPWALTFEVWTDDIASLENFYLAKDVVTVLHFENTSGSHLHLLIPYQPLHVFLGRKGDLYAR